MDNEITTMEPRLFRPFLLVVISWIGSHHVVLSSGISQLNYKTVKSTAFPQNINFYGQPRTVHNLIHCTTLCASDPLCKAIYLKDENGSKSTCHLYSQSVADHQLLSPGTGTYAYFSTFTTTEIPQTYSVATLLYTTWYEPEETIVAVHSLSGVSHWKTLGVLYDRNINQFPHLSSACAQTIYQAMGLSSTIVSITEEVPGSSYRLHVICQEGETKQGDATCDSNGNWDIEGPLGVACVSTECYRVAINGYARYSGTAKHTRYGTGCSNWRNYYYYYDYQFPLDNNDKTQANNYCRDPRGYGQPWCKMGSYYDYCSVPKCNWQP